MRVRPLAPTERRTRSERRPHIFGRPAPEAQPAPAATPDPDPAPRAQRTDEHLAEDRHRASVTPEDTAHYGCSCGFQFQAPVSTSVSCPHCGTDQAW